uniref:Uncharacterized protein n=1 Tax=Populus trichocarpa TaxID=3694 RepID=A0A2K1WQY3_POPTR
MHTNTRSKVYKFKPPFSSTTRKFVYDKSYFLMMRNLDEIKVSFQPLNRFFLRKSLIIEWNLIKLRNRLPRGKSPSKFLLFTILVCVTC